MCAERVAADTVVNTYENLNNKFSKISFFSHNISYIHMPSFMHLSHKRMSSILYFISFFTWQFRLRSISAGWSCCAFCSKSLCWRTPSCWWWWRWCWSSTTLLSLIIFLRLLHCNEPQSNAFDSQAQAGDLLHSGWLQAHKHTYMQTHIYIYICLSTSIRCDKYRVAFIAFNCDTLWICFICWLAASPTVYSQYVPLQIAWVAGKFVCGAYT